MSNGDYKRILHNNVTRKTTHLSLLLLQVKYLDRLDNLNDSLIGRRSLDVPHEQLVTRLTDEHTVGQPQKAFNRLRVAVKLVRQLALRQVSYEHALSVGA